jgi:transcriptional regulator with XRE-family HTH domain
MTAADFTAARKALNLTQSEWGERLGLHRVTVARIESGTRAVTPTIALLVDAIRQGYEPSRNLTIPPA